ncbi:hypothetical protein [Pelistega ratti]|uniref:hypothetical protein n=1 Tax=Pelistega ratti TaxID=2652177 RepID=UPI00135B4854|nr:hypothetical protein [Pelistega ratti]
MDKENFVLCITEGEKLDPRILNKFKTEFVSKNMKIFPICLNIYNLYKKFTDYEDFGSEFLDTFALIKEISLQQKSSADPELQILQRNQISEIFLFFDYDGHDTVASKYPDCINDMLNLFNDETGNGKLYINYPMIESYKHPIHEECVIVDISPDEHYKTYVSRICNKKFEQIIKLTKNDWFSIFSSHLKSINYLILDNFSFPVEYKSTINFNQKEIYKMQLEKYINPAHKLLVLSSFPLFLIEYLGNGLFNEWKNFEERTIK